MYKTIRSSPPDVLSKKDALQTWSKLTREQQCRSAISIKPLRSFIKITPHKQIGPRKSAAHPQNTLLCERTSEELLLHVKRSLKYLIYKKFLFIIVKRNLLTLKMNKKQINKNKNNKYPVIVSRSLREALRFFHWAL